MERFRHADRYQVTIDNTNTNLNALHLRLAIMDNRIGNSTITTIEHGMNVGLQKYV